MEQGREVERAMVKIRVEVGEGQLFCASLIRLAQFLAADCYIGQDQDAWRRPTPQ
jgi:hypothetical protein